MATPTTQVSKVYGEVVTNSTLAASTGVRKSYVEVVTDSLTTYPASTRMRKQWVEVITEAVVAPKVPVICICT